MKRWTKAAVPILAVVGLVVGLGLGVASASIPDHSGVIHGCYKRTANGSITPLLVYDSAKSKCPSNQTELDWNQKGAQGPPGPQGPPGASGTVLDTGILTYSVTGTNPDFQAHCSLSHLTGPHAASLTASLGAPSFSSPGGDGCLISGMPAGEDNTMMIQFISGVPNAIGYGPPAVATGDAPSGSTLSNGYTVPPGDAFIELPDGGAPVDVYFQMVASS
jgi:hypothetical protein